MFTPSVWSLASRLVFIVITWNVLLGIGSVLSLARIFVFSVAALTWFAVNVWDERS